MTPWLFSRQLLLQGGAGMSAVRAKRPLEGAGARTGLPDLQSQTGSAESSGDENSSDVDNRKRARMDGDGPALAGKALVSDAKAASLPTMKDAPAAVAAAPLPSAGREGSAAIATSTQQQAQSSDNGLGGAATAGGEHPSASALDALAMLGTIAASARPPAAPPTPVAATVSTASAAAAAAAARSPLRTSLHNSSCSSSPAAPRRGASSPAAASAAGAAVAALAAAAAVRGGTGSSAARAAGTSTPIPLPSLVLNCGSPGRPPAILCSPFASSPLAKYKGSAMTMAAAVTAAAASPVRCLAAAQQQLPPSGSGGPLVVSIAAEGPPGRPLVWPVMPNSEWVIAAKEQSAGLPPPPPDDRGLL